MNKFIVINNQDKRLKYMMDYLRKKHVVVDIDNEDDLYQEIRKVGERTIILPIRGVSKEFVVDGTHIKLTENDLMLLRNQCIFTGLVNDEFKKRCAAYNIKLISYLTDDFTIQNNYITVEGIIEAIVKHSEKSIYDAKTLIIGYGRLGQITAKVFKTMKADVTVSARSDKDLTHAKIDEYHTLYHHEIEKDISKYDFIINTIPYQIIDHLLLETIKTHDILIIDVASYPFGLDHEYAQSIGVKALNLPGIPGKVAPLTSGRLLGKHIEEIISGGEVVER